MYQKNVYQLREALFEKFDSFGIPYTDNQKLFNNMAIFDSESIWVDVENFKDTEATTWIGKHIPISVSIASNSKKEPIFLCHLNPCDLVSFFVDALSILATQNKAQLKKNFFQIQTTRKK